VINSKECHFNFERTLFDQSTSSQSGSFKINLILKLNVFFFADGITIRDRWDRLVHSTTNPKAQDAVKTILDLAKKIRKNPPIPRTGKIKSGFFWSNRCVRHQAVIRVFALKSRACRDL